MKEQDRIEMGLEIAEIERLVREFKEKFAEGTADADEFITISEIELMWESLQCKTNSIYSGMIKALMADVDESDLIRKKKGFTD